MEIMILTGMSGAGKTFVGNVLEDYGYYCIDNIPVALLTQFIDLYLHQENQNGKVAFVVDVRGCNDFSLLLTMIRQIKSDDEHTARLIFLDCANETLIKRYKESRHVHPLVLSKNITLNKALIEEREMLAACKQEADFVIDTTHLTTTACREYVISILSGGETPVMNISLVSFGFKNGAPLDADLMFDVRCFPNPFYIPELKNLTGLDDAVYEYVTSFEETKAFLSNLYQLIDQLLPLYQDDGRSHLTIAIGCTGGKHRSVTVVRALAEHLRVNRRIKAYISHRDILK